MGKIKSKLQKYNQQRDFEKTPEPEAKKEDSKPDSPFFVVQQHSASNLHYDFRFSYKKSLKSWALPKGPSLRPSEKRLALRTEDHPIDYAGFEGVIPEGQYGAGEVIVWDRGPIKIKGKVKKGLKEGQLHFRLKGQKLRGAFDLIRIDGDDGPEGERWILVKNKDKHAQTDDRRKSVTKAEPESVLSGKKIQEIHEETLACEKKIGEFEGVRRKKVPRKLQPSLPISVDRPPEGKDWIHERDWEGRRLLVEKRGGKVSLLSRDREDWTDRFPELVEEIGNLCEYDFIIDGAVVVLDENNRSDARLLREWLKNKGGGDLRFCVFDVLHLLKHDLRKTPLRERKKILEHWFYERRSQRHFVHASHYSAEDGTECLAQAYRNGWEGIVSKRVDSTYEEGRNRSWQKTKCVPISHPTRTMDRPSGATKGDIAAYYAMAGQVILPFLAGRPLTLVRCPGGREDSCFFQKHFDSSVPESVDTVEIPEKSGKGTYGVVASVAGLVSLAQWGAVEIHSWGSRADHDDFPRQLVFDLDPGKGVRWTTVLEGARRLREILEHLGLTSFVKTTGGKGLHVCVPLARSADWDGAREFCRRVAMHLQKEDPAKFIAKATKSERRGKVFVDYLRNSRGATVVVPYSLRARPGLPVSVPLDWEELDADLRSDHWNIGNIEDRLPENHPDPWVAFTKSRQKLTEKRMDSV